MKKATFALLCLACFAATALSSPAEWDLSTVEDEGDMLELYRKYRTAYPLGLEAASSHDNRYEAFKDNIKFIKETNAKVKNYSLGITPFTDMTFDEFSAKYLSPVDDVSYLFAKSLRGASDNNVETEVPSSKDWSEYVNPARQQGQCGSCWAFSSTNTLAAHTAIKNDNCPNLSVQYVVDCVKQHDPVDQKCRGAQIDAGWRFMAANGAVAESQYPYKCGSGVTNACAESQCRAGDSNLKIVATVSDYMPVEGHDEMKQALGTKGPIQHMMYVTREFMHYTGGVFDESPECASAESVNHGMMGIGYGSENGQDYWTIMNSWGEEWGMKGVSHVARGNNFCNVELVGIYPTSGV